MTPGSIASIAAIAALVAIPSGPAQAQERTAQETAALAVADSALAAISRLDFVAFTDLMLDSAVTYSVRERDGQFRTNFRTRARERATQASGRFTERGFDPEVRVSGPLAMVWLPYDFYLDGKWSHCGVDVFTLLMTADGWRIATLAWSVEQPPVCRAHPDGPPQPSGGP